MGLLYLLAELAPRLQLRLSVASVDHGLRPEAQDEIRMVAEASDALGIPFRALKVQLSGDANLQSRARELRYEALRSEARRRDAGIALGHTQDDQAETVLGRIARGAGLRGLGGIQPLRRDGVVRPLLDQRRKAIRAYLEERGVSWAEDPSNQSDAFERVRLRRLLRTLEEEDPQLCTHLSELADDARDAEDVLRSASAALGPDLVALAAAPSALRRVAIRRLAEEETGRGLRRRHLEELERCVLRQGGEVLLGGGWRARPQGGRLRFEKGDWRGRSG